MLNEQRVSAYFYEPKTDTLHLETHPPLTFRGGVTGQALLDSQGNLVGIDLEPETARLVLMIGEHEGVAGQQPIRAQCDAAGRLLIADAKKLKAHVRNPHWQGK